MTVNTDTQSALFEGGPFPHLQRSLGLFRPVGTAVSARAVVVILVGWFPLLVLVLADSLSGGSAFTSLLKDFGTHSRSLVAAPLFVVCEGVCLKRLEAVASYFTLAHLIRAESLRDFRRLIEKGRTLINSTLLEVLAIAGAYLIVLLAYRYIPPRIMPVWFYVENSNHLMSWAGWWYTVVSVPLLLVLVFGWLLRVLVWGWFLFRVSKMNLRLIPAHPDHAAGLRFLNAQLFAFMPLAFTFGIMAAGAVANRIAYHGGSTHELQRTAIGLVIFVVIVFVGPLMIFIANLHHQKIDGIYSYGLLADALGKQFERKWLVNYEKVGQDALEAPDFSATTDLYQVADNVYKITIVPFEIRTLIVLCVTALLPFVPVLLMLVPIKVILKEIASLIFGGVIG